MWHDTNIINKITDAEISYEGNDASLAIHTTIREITEMTSDDVSDLLYISETVHLPEKKDIKRCYRTDFRLLTNQEAQRICKRKEGIYIGQIYKNNQFFVYNERREELVPFKQNDYLMNEKEYMTFDGKKYIYYDNDGNFKQCMKMKNNVCSYYDEKWEILYKETLLNHVEEEDAEILLKKENKKPYKK